MHRIQDDSFANGLYFGLLNREFRKVGSAQRELMSWRSIAGMIANLRDVGEYYLDFYPQGLWPAPPRIDPREIVAELGGAGWHLVTAEERFEEHQLAWELLRAYERRPPGPLPQWAASLKIPTLKHGLSSPSAPLKLRSEADARRLQALNTRHRLIVMALLGQITESEFEILQKQNQRTFDTYERREHGATPDWAAKLETELRALEAEHMESWYPGALRMTQDQRDEIFCAGLYRRVVALGRSGRVTKEEIDKLWPMFDPERHR
jgi:hypothetical protein